MEIIIKDKKHLPAAAKKLLDYTGEKRIFAFYGSMGAGKTTIFPLNSILSVCGSILFATVAIFFPLTKTNPCVTRVSALRREATPASDKNLAIFIVAILNFVVRGWVIKNAVDKILLRIS